MNIMRKLMSEYDHSRYEFYRAEENLKRAKKKFEKFCFSEYGGWCEDDYGSYMIFVIASYFIISR